MPLRVRRPWVEDWSWDLRLRRRSCCSGGLLRPLCCCCGRGEGGKGDECGRTVLLLFGVLQSAFRVFQKYNIKIQYTPS